VSGEVIGTAESAKLLGISRRTMQRRGERGELDSEIVGSTRIFKRTDVENYAKEQQ